MTSAVYESAISSRSDSILDDVLEDVANRLQAGEPVDCAAILAKYPEHAESLGRLLPAVEVMAEFGVSASRLAARGVPPDLGTLDNTLGVLGDFEIVREAGRGGMGVVYEARQISLNRRVALKVLPLAAAMEPRSLQRFQLEAQAAACLHHTNIVPIHAVGCERGVHYYAMQFIDGQTLAAIIGELRVLEGRDKADETTSNDSLPSLASRLAAGRLAGSEPEPPEHTPSPHLAKGGSGGGGQRSSDRQKGALNRPLLNLHPHPRILPHRRPPGHPGRRGH